MSSLLRRGFQENRAHELVIEYESHKHHQHYWAGRIPNVQPDFAGMLQQQLHDGSSLGCALKVLKNQNASLSECIKAVSEVRQVTLDEAARVVDESKCFQE